jgi:DNA-binding response OmpR family regulator
LTDLAILIAEDEVLLALDLAAALEDRGAHVIGPVLTVAEGLAMAERGGIAAAILDANLLDRDITPLALRLIDQGVPFVIHTGTGLPEDLARAHPELKVVMKPALPETVLRALDMEMSKRRGELAGPELSPQETMRLDVPGQDAGRPG